MYSWWDWDCNAVANGIVAVSVVALLISKLILVRRKPSRFLKSIPIIQNDSAFGFTNALTSKTGNTHAVMLALSEKYGSLFQFELFGQHVVAVNDKEMIKDALKNVHGKGFFHV